MSHQISIFFSPAFPSHFLRLILRTLSLLYTNFETKVKIERNTVRETFSLKYVSYSG